MLFRLISGVSAALLSATAAFADPPVGIATGQTFYEPADPSPGGRGGRLYAGPWGESGRYELLTGEALTLGPGGGSPGRERRPSMIVGGLGGSGTVTIANSSTLALNGDNGGPSIFIGEEGAPGDRSTGAFNVLSGASLTMTDLGLRDIDARIGENGVKFNIGRDHGTGALTVDAGILSMTSSSRVLIGVADEANATGTATFSNGAVATLREVAIPGATPNGVELRVGTDGSTGDVVIDKASVTLESDAGHALADIGISGGFGSLNLTGAAAEMIVSGASAALRVGIRGTGTAVVDGGDLQILAQPGQNASVGVGVMAGDTGTAIGTMTVSGGSTVTVSGGFGQIEIGDLAPVAGATSIATMIFSGPGTHVTASHRVTVGRESGAGTTTAVLSVADGAVLTAPNIDIFDGGALVGSGGTVTGNVQVNAGGTVAPGFSPGTLALDGDLIFGSGSVLEIEIDGQLPGQFDVVNISGTLAATDSFFLQLIFNGYLPGVGEVFEFLTFDDAQADFADLAQVEITGLGAGSVFDFRATSTSLSAVASVVVPPVPVPLPAGVSLLAAALGMLAGVCRFCRPGRSGRQDAGPFSKDGICVT